MKTFIPVIMLLFAVLFIGNGIIFSQETVNDIINNKRGVQLGEMNRLDEAIKEFDRAIELRDKAAAKSYHNKAYSLERKNDLEGAIKNYDEAWKRNPKQIVTGERLGWCYYLTGDYERAVLMGEAVLKLDPNNKDVPRWLSDAYKKRMIKRQEDILAEKKRKEENAQRKIDELDQKKLDNQKEKERRQIVYVAIDAMLRTGLFYGNKYHYGGLYYTTPHNYRVITEHGHPFDTPTTIFVKLTPLPFLQIDFTIEKPWLGGCMPNFIESMEKTELIFHFKKGMIGAGVMFNHYDSNAAFYHRYKLTDTKVGIIVGYKNDKVETKFSWYPRMLLMDPRSSTGKTLDVGQLRIDYSYQISSYFKIYLLINARDYYVFAHSPDWRIYYASYYRYIQDVASYWGVYDLGVGVTINDLIYKADDTVISFSFEWIERFYLRNLNNNKPYTLAPNGQGWFGLNLRTYLKGKPFSGFRALSQVLGLRFDEQITKNFFMWEKINFEIADQNSEHHEINFQLGLGAKY